jgi:hypothetical protein
MLNNKIKNKMNILKKGSYILLLLLLSITISCEEDNDDVATIAGLDFVVATLNSNGTKAGVVPTTAYGNGNILYTVDFGATADSDTDVLPTSGPMVTYDYPEVTATYVITVTASLEGTTDVSITKEHTVTFVVAPPAGGGGGSANPLAGTWKLAPEAGALGVGPAQDNVSWWSNGDADVATRSCLFDDEYVFNADGTFENVLGTETWLEGWQGTDPEACGAPVFPHDGSTIGAEYAYDAAAGTITINGRGAYVGLAKAVNGAELASPADAPDSVTYIAKLDGDVLEIDIEVAGGGFWSFKLVRQGAPSVVGTWKLAPEAGALGVGPAQDNVSWWSNGDADVATRSCLFDDEYVFNADGSFQNVLGTETWLEGWQGVDPEACGTPIFPHDGAATATYVHDATAESIVIDGKGAFLGLAKAVNGAELASPSAAPDSVTYIAKLDGDVLELDVEVAGGGFWSFKLVRQ